MTRREPSPSRGRERLSATILDVAREAGVSKSTVSNVLQEKNSVAAELRERVQAAMRELDYQPHAGARYLRQRPKLLGVVVGDLTNPFHAELATKIEAHAERLQHTVLLVTTGGTPHREVDRVRWLLEHRVAALIFVSAPSAEVSSLVSRRTPVVLASVTARGYPWIAVDDARGTQLAVQHLVQLGHARIGFVSDTIDDERTTELARFRGYSAGIQEAGLEARHGDILRPSRGRDLTTPAQDKYASYLHRADGPTAVVAATDRIAVDLMAAADQVGLRVPEDISIVGFDNISIAGWSRVSLTTVAQPMDEIARHAVEFAIERTLPGAHRPRQRIQFAPQLIVRGSTSAPR